MKLSNLFSSCVFRHDRDPLFVLVEGVTHFQCSRCQADLGPVLAGQKYRARKVPKVKKRRSQEREKVTPIRRSA